MDPAYGRDVKLWIGQGATAVDLSEALGNFSITHDVAVSGPHGLADGKSSQRFYPVPGTDAWRLEFGRFLILDEGNARRIYQWFMGLGVDEVGNILADFSETTENADECVYWRNPVKGSASLALPVADLADLTGALRSALAVAGTVGARAEIGRVDADSLSQAAFPDAAAITVPTPASNAFVLALTEARDGTTDVVLQRKRGAAAWTTLTGSDLTRQLAVAQTTANSVVELLAVAENADVQAGDMLRLTYDPLPGDGERWMGKLAVCAEVEF